MDALLTEQTQKVVLEREVEAGLARVSLTPSAAAQLVIDAPSLMTLGADDAQSSKHADGIALAVGDVPCLSVGRVELPFCSRLLIFHTELLKGGLTKHLIVASEQDVGSAASHVGGDGDRAKPARLGYDRSLALVLFRVEHLVPDATFGKLLRQPLGSLHRRRAHEHGLPLGVTALYLVGNGGELDLGSAENQVAFVFADHGLVRGNRDDGHVVDAAKLAVGGKCRARHAGKLLVQAEVVL